MINKKIVCTKCKISLEVYGKDRDEKKNYCYFCAKDFYLNEFKILLFQGFIIFLSIIIGLISLCYDRKTKVY